MISEITCLWFLGPRGLAPTRGEALRWCVLAFEPNLRTFEEWEKRAIFRGWRSARNGVSCGEFCWPHDLEGEGESWTRGMVELVEAFSWDLVIEMEAGLTGRNCALDLQN